MSVGAGMCLRDRGREQMRQDINELLGELRKGYRKAEKDRKSIPVRKTGRKERDTTPLS